MKTVLLDASKWKTPIDFYNALLPTLGAPEWHGRNLNALIESMIWGEINAVEPPYAVEIHSTENLPAKLCES